MNRNWLPIDHYPDAMLRRMARDGRDMRSGAAQREIDRRRNATSNKGGTDREQ